MGWGSVFGSLAGAGLSAGLSSHQAKKQRQWQEKMRSTAYQATMKDMRLAGLNPILAYKSGATSAGAGAMGQTPDFGAAFVGGVNAETNKDNAVTNRWNWDTGRKTAPYERALKKRQAARVVAEWDLLRAQTSAQEANARQGNAAAAITEAGIPAANARAEFDRHDWGRKLNQLSHGAGMVGQTAGAVGAVVNSATGFRSKVKVTRPKTKTKREPVVGPLDDYRHKKGSRAGAKKIYKGKIREEDIPY